MDRLSSQSERLILDSVTDVVSHVSGGMDPTDAVVKVAEERELSPNFVNLVVCGYNVGATNHHRESSSSILDKMAAFPLARLEEAMLRLYPKVTEESVKAAAAAGVISAEYSRRPDKVTKYDAQDKANLFKAAAAVFEKAASKSPGLTFEKKVDRCNHILAKKAEVERSRHTAAIAKEEFIAALGALADHVQVTKMAGHDVDRLMFAAGQEFGDVGKYVVAYAVNRAGNVHKRQPDKFREKVAEMVQAKVTVPVYSQAVRWNAAPYSLVASCVKAAERSRKLANEHNDFVAVTVKNITKMFPEKAAEESRPRSVLDVGQNKEGKTVSGGFFSGLATGAVMRGGGMAANSAAPKATGDLVDSAAASLDDPDHNEELRQIRVRAMLQDFLNNDEVLAGYDPEEVFDAFNEISSIAPRVAEQPAAVRALLRQRMSTGALQPFETNEIATLEKTLKQTQAPASDFSTKASNVLRRTRSVILG